MKVPEQYRVKDHKYLSSDSSYGCNGFFVIPHFKIKDYQLNCQVSDGMFWQHVSVSLTKSIRKKNALTVVAVERCATWSEMCFIKSLFWDDEETVMQLHPPKSMWVNNHPYCLHLWKPDHYEIPLPLQAMVGIPEFNSTKNLTT